MRPRSLETLLVEDDVDLADLLGRFLQESVQASVTHVESGADAVREELTTRHRLAVISLSLANENALDIVRAVRRHNDCPVLLLAESPTAEEAIEAMRLGVVDILIKPFEMDQLAAAVRKATEHYRARRRERSRHRRLRKLVARIICERRDLARRIDLICRDFVLAHKRLAQKITASGMLSRRDE